MVSPSPEKVTDSMRLIFRYESQVRCTSIAEILCLVCSIRLRHAGYRISRPPNTIGRYRMIRHEKQAPALNRFVS